MTIAADNLELYLRERNERRRMGRYYTPAVLVDLILDHALDPEIRRRSGDADALLSLRIVDPACGIGNFLVPAATRIASALALTDVYRDRDGADAYRDVLRHCIFGVDLDGQAVNGCGDELSRDDGDAEIVRRNIRCGDALLTDGEHGFNWIAEFPDVMSVGGFDLVIGNPPFVNAIEKHRADELRPRLRRAFPRLGGTADLAACFLDRATTLVKVDGRIGFVLPRTILGASACRTLRADISATLPPNLIFAPERCDWFEDASVFVVALVLGPEATCRISRDPEPTSAKWRTTAVVGGNWWNAVAETSSDDIAPSPSPRATVGDTFDIVASMTTGEAYAMVPFLRDRPRGMAQKLVTTGLIDPGKCAWGRSPCRYLKTDYAHPRVPANGAMLPSLQRRIARSRRPKIIVAGLSREVEAFLDRRGKFIGTVSTYSIFHPTDDVGELEQLLSLLLARGTTQRFIATLGASGLRGMHLTMTKGFLKGLDWADASGSLSSPERVGVRDVNL